MFWLHRLVEMTKQGHSFSLGHTKAHLNLIGLGWQFVKEEMVFTVFEEEGSAVFS